jgi:hypothetical protein
MEEAMNRQADHMEDLEHMEDLDHMEDLSHIMEEYFMQLLMQ